MIPSQDDMYRALEARHGAQRQARFAAGRVAVCGLGGLGSQIALSLARAGVGFLHLIDFDQVELSNLNRQQYTISQLGQWKTEALRDTLAAVAPYCHVRIDTIRVTDAHIPALFQEDHILCEAFDRPEDKAMLTAAVLKRCPWLVLIAASGMAGLASANQIHTRRVSRRFYLCGDETSDLSDGLGLVGPRAMVCAAHQATMVLRLLNGMPDP